MRVQGAGQNCRLTTEVSEFTQRNAGSLEILLSGIQIPGKKGHPLLLRFSFSHSQTTRTAIQRPTRNNVNKWRVTMQTLDLARKWTVRFQIKDRLLYAKLLYNESSSAASLVIQVTCKDAPLTLLQQATTSKRLFFFFPSKYWASVQRRLCVHSRSMQTLLRGTNDSVECKIIAFPFSRNYYRSLGSLLVFHHIKKSMILWVLGIFEAVTHEGLKCIMWQGLIHIVACPQGSDDYERMV